MNKKTFTRRLNNLIREFNATNKEEFVDDKSLTSGTIAIRFLDRAARRKDWVEQHYYGYLDDVAVEPAIICPEQKIVVLRSHDRGVSAAMCNESDIFESEVGVAVAYARLCGEKIPAFV